MVEWTLQKRAEKMINKVYALYFPLIVVITLEIGIIWVLSIWGSNYDQIRKRSTEIQEPTKER